MQTRASRVQRLQNQQQKRVKDITPTAAGSSHETISRKNVETEEELSPLLFVPSAEEANYKETYQVKTYEVVQKTLLKINIFPTEIISIK